LEENALGGEGAAYIADMLKENGFITGLVSLPGLLEGLKSEYTVAYRETRTAAVKIRKWRTDQH